MVLEGCRGRWSVIVDRGVLEFFKERGLARELEEWRRSLEEGLNRDPGMILRLLREPVIYEYAGVKWRRYRLYPRGKGYRLLYAVNTRLCLVYFAAAEKRDEETYRRLGEEALGPALPAVPF